ncbi:MAG: hypothetical protein COA47_08270 [Robiginitomaculum sp.]|nr:MAG: hypothetical protein COA47_08270 [Robiginitomaculum sp.]
MTGITTLSAKTILVAETQPFLRSIIVDILRNIGITKIHTAGSCTEAVTQIRTWLPDAIIMDWNLKGGTGVKLANWIRTGNNSPNLELPIVIVTGDTAHEKILEARDCGIDEIIVKPVVPKAVISRVKLLFMAKRDFVSSHSFIGPDRRRRQNGNYKGSKRRLKDASENVATSIDAAFLAQADQIQSLLKEMNVNDRGAVMTLYRASQTLWEDAAEHEDNHLEEIAKSLIGYVQAMGASGKLEIKVIAKHIDAIHQLKDLIEQGNTDPSSMLNELKKHVADQVSNSQAA